MKKSLLATQGLFLLALPVSGQTPLSMCVAESSGLRQADLLVQPSGDTTVVATGEQWLRYHEFKKGSYATGSDWWEPMTRSGTWWTREEQPLSVPTSDLTYLGAVAGVPVFIRAGENDTFYLPRQPGEGACEFVRFRDTGSAEAPPPSSAELRVVKASDIQADRRRTDVQVVEVRLARGYVDVVVLFRTGNAAREVTLAAPGQERAFYITEPFNTRFPLVSQQGWPGKGPGGFGSVTLPPRTEHRVTLRFKPIPGHRQLPFFGLYEGSCTNPTFCMTITKVTLGDRR